MSAGASAQRVRALVPEAILLAVSFVWGATFVVIGDALDHASPLLFVAVRFTLASVLLAPVVLARSGVPGRAVRKAGGIVGFWLFVGFALQTAGLVETPPARAAFLTSLYVVLVPVFLVALRRRRPGGRSIAGVLLATLGLALLTGAGFGGGPTRGDLLVLGCAAAFALQILAVADHLTDDPGGGVVDPLLLLLVEMAVVAGLAWPAAALFENLRWDGRADLWRAVGIVTVFATLLALWGQNVAQRRIPPTRTAILFTTEPVFAALTSWYLTGERFGPAAIGGCVLILAGMLAAVLLAPPEGRW